MVTYITFQGDEQVVDVQAGYSVMEGAIGNGIEGISAVCGGNSYCGTCRVYVDPDWQQKIDEMSETEISILESTGDENPSARLSCQIALTEELSGLIVRLPERQC